MRSVWIKLADDLAIPQPASVPACSRAGCGASTTLARCSGCEFVRYCAGPDSTCQRCVISSADDTNAAQPRLAERPPSPVQVAQGRLLIARGRPEAFSTSTLYSRTICVDELVMLLTACPQHRAGLAGARASDRPNSGFQVAVLDSAGPLPLAHAAPSPLARLCLRAGLRSRPRNSPRCSVPRQAIAASTIARGATVARSLANCAAPSARFTERPAHRLRERPTSAHQRRDDACQRDDGPARITRRACAVPTRTRRGSQRPI